MEIENDDVINAKWSPKIPSLIGLETLKGSINFY